MHYTRKPIKYQQKRRGSRRYSKVNKHLIISGKFFSAKNNKVFLFRSAYEFAFFYTLEKDCNVLSYQVEPFKIPYKNPYDKKIHYYYPDVLIMYKNNKTILAEIKPQSMLNNVIVKRKAAAARRYLKDNNVADKYIFITEKDIFISKDDYERLKSILRSNINNYDK